MVVGRKANLPIICTSVARHRYRRGAERENRIGCCDVPVSDPNFGYRTPTQKEHLLMHAPSRRARLLTGVAATAILGVTGIASAATTKVEHTTFPMFPQSTLLNCLKPSPGAPTPQATVTVNRNDLNDRATVELRGFKPNLDFDLSTIQHSPQTANGAADVNPSVGLAWYQSDLHVGADGSGRARI